MGVYSKWNNTHEKINNTARVTVFIYCSLTFADFVADDLDNSYCHGQNIFVASCRYWNE